MDNQIQFRHGELDITFERFNDRYRLTVDNFPSEEAAAGYVTSVWKALAWMFVNSGFAFAAETELQTVSYVDDPASAARGIEKRWGVRTEGRVDTLLDGGRPAVVQSDKKLWTITGGTPRIVLSTPVERVKEAILEGLSFSSAFGERTRTAVDLYGAYYSETTGNGRLISLVMALETLIVPQQKSRRALELLANWQTELSQAKGSVLKDSDEYMGLDALEREVVFRQERSIRSSLRKFVLETLAAFGEADALEQSQRAVRVYDLRSRLVHEGSLETRELGLAVQQAKEIVEAVLRAKLASH